MADRAILFAHPRYGKRSFANKMYKKILLIIFLTLVFGCTLQAQGTKVDKFLDSYEAFVTEVVAMPFDAFHGDTMSYVEKQQHKFVRRYRWYFDDRMSIDQLERFNQLRGRFNRKMTALKNRRRLAATKGRIKGYFTSPHTPRDTVDAD